MVVVVDSKYMWRHTEFATTILVAAVAGDDRKHGHLKHTLLTVFGISKNKISGQRKRSRAKRDPLNFLLCLTFLHVGETVKLTGLNKVLYFLSNM